MRATTGLVMLIATVLVPAIGVAAEDRDISFDAGVDFRELKTFTIRPGNVTSDKPEIDNRLFRQRMEYTIRDTLLRKKLVEARDTPDMTVTFHFSERDVSSVERTGPSRIPDSPAARGFVIPGSRPSPVMFSEGTLVVDVHDASGKLLWRGTWRDQESSGPKLSSELSEYARRLLRDFPPRRKQGLIQ